MNAEQVVEKIISDAQSQAQKIKEDASKQLADEQKKNDAELVRFREETDKLASQAAEDKKQRMLAAARMETAKNKLAAKRDILNQVFERAAQKILEQNDDDYKRLMSNLMKKAVETGDEEILVAQDESRIDNDFMKKLNRELGNGFKGNLRLSNEKVPGKAGFILRRGKVRTNVTLKVLLEQAAEALETEIADELFPKDSQQ